MPGAPLRTNRFIQSQKQKTDHTEPLTKLKSAVVFFQKKLSKTCVIWYHISVENSVIMGC